MEKGVSKTKRGNHLKFQLNIPSKPPTSYKNYNLPPKILSLKPNFLMLDEIYFTFSAVNVLIY